MDKKQAPKNYHGWSGRSGLLEHLPDNRLNALEPGQVVGVAFSPVDLKLGDEFVARRTLNINIQLLQGHERVLSLSMLRVRLPAARLHLVAVDAPENELLLEQRPANTLGIVQLARPIVVEDLREDARVAIKKVLVRHRVIVGQGLCQPRQACCLDLFQDLLVRLEPGASNVEDDSICHVDLIQC